MEIHKILDLTLKDLEKIADFQDSDKQNIKKIQIITTKERILHICRDQPTHLHIDSIRSASIKIKGIWFELIKSD